MVVHEVQSDWAEGGSKYGVASEAKEAEYRAEQQELRDAEQQFADTFPELRDAIADYMNNSDYYISDLNTWYLDLGYNEKLAAQMDRPHPNPNISYSDWSGHKALLDSAIFDENGNAVKPNADNFVILPYAGATAGAIPNDQLYRQYRNAYDAFKERGQEYHEEQSRRFYKATSIFTKAPEQP